MPIFHRIDDIYACRPDLMQILALFERLGLPAILGVIPKRLTPEMSAYLAQRHQFLIYQHGQEHKNYAASGRKDEFPASRTFDDILANVATGRRSIEAAIGRPVNGYIPPWNTASVPLIKAITQLGFTHVSANRSAVIPAPLAHLPCAVDTLESYTPVRVRSSADTIDQLRGARQDGDVTGVVHHIKNLGETGMREVEAVITWSSPHRMSDEAWRPFAGQLPTNAA
jgi:hypothetical protein